MAAAKPRVNPISFVRRAGPAVAARQLVEQSWWKKLYLGLRCDLTALPPLRPAKVEVRMEPRDARTFSGFDDELGRIGGPDYLEVMIRRWLSEAGVKTLYVAFSDEGDPMYAQWLVRARDQHVMKEHAPGSHPDLAPDEVLLEGAYTFSRFRRLGLMNDGMAQLLRIARAEGGVSAITYVPAENVASLRGCANVGFVLDHVRVNERRLGRRRSLAGPPDPRARAAWEAATAPHTP